MGEDRRVVALPESLLVEMRAAIWELGPETEADIVLENVLEILGNHLAISFETEPQEGAAAC